MRFFFLLPLFLLSACAAMEEQFQAQYCHREGGYEKGVNDAQEGNPMNSGFASQCNPETRKEVMQAYREGYEKATNQISADEDGIVVKMPGVDIRMGNKNNKSWACKIDIFGKNYKGYGTSRAQAASDTRRLCEEDNNAVHCNSMQCKQER